MDTDAPALSIIYSKAAHRALDDIWTWNAKTYSGEHATDYIHFLQGRIATLATEHAAGKIVDADPTFRYVTMKRSSRGDGHVAVYRMKGKTVRILRIFHTKQDWQSKL